jgi:branched-chain amino acid aminotransferase
MSASVNIDWDNIGFKYMKTDLRYLATWKEGRWEEGRLVKDNNLSIGECAPALHYGQQCFEGLKAYRTKTGDIQLFRATENARRFNRSASRLLMPEIPEEMFLNAVLQVVRANSSYVPPYGSGATFYIRPFMLGVGNYIAAGPAPEYLFSVFCFPVGPYFKGGMTPVNFMVSDFDRAAPYGTGAAKVGGNYAASFYPNKLAKESGFADCIYLDPLTHTKIEEVGAANFFGITQDNEFVTPASPSILPSITKYSLLYLSREYLQLKASERDVLIDNLGEFKEAGACGTAAVITPIGGIQYKGRLHVFHSETEVGPITKKLYDTLCAIQFGDAEAPSGWIIKA